MANLLTPAQFTPSYVAQRSKELKEFWRERTVHIEEVWNLLQLKDTNASAIFESAVDNEPRAMFDLAVHLLSSLPHRTRLQVGEDLQVREQAENCQRALTSIWRKIDEIRESLDPFAVEYSTYLLSTGWRHIRYWLDPSATMPFRIINDNPRESFPWFADDRVMQYVHSYQVYAHEAALRAREVGGDVPNVRNASDKIFLHDYYELVWLNGKLEAYNMLSWDYDNVQVAANRGWLKPPTALNLSHLPIICGPVGGFPDRTMTGWQGRVGASVLDSNMGLYKTGDKWLSAFTQQIKEMMKPTILWRDVRPPDVADQVGMDLRDRSGRDVFVEGGGTGDPKATPVVVNINSDFINLLLSKLEGMRQRGLFPYLAFGGLDVRLSGFAIQQLFQAIYYKLGRYLQTAVRDTRQIERDWLSQYRTSTAPKIFIAGTKVGINGESIPFEMPFQPADVPEHFDIEVTRELALPSDMINRISAARTALPGDWPVLDIDTVVEEVLKMDDPQRIIRGIKSNMTERDPMEQAITNILEFRARARRLRDSGNPDGAELAQLYEEIADAIKMKLAAASQPAQGAMGVQQPSPEAAPPQTTGVSPDQVRALMSASRGGMGNVSARQRQIAEAEAQ